MNRNGATSKDLNSTNTGVPEAGIQDYGFDRAKVQFKVSRGQNILDVFCCSITVLVKDCCGSGALVRLLSSRATWLNICLFLLTSKTEGEKFTL